ncbi:MAG TPA: hypothetical protein PLW35_13025, partial [Verrucomicrobiota bacterium]|nr:hypothetical protein [Verrucomicrobiota bacterium]
MNGTRPTPLSVSARDNGVAKVLAIALSLAVLAGCGRPDRSPRLGSETIEAMNQGVGFMGQY